jgi:isoquinoline 1-oxidoreductase beta subunit
MKLTMTRRTFLKATALGLTGLTLGCTLDPWPPDAESSDVTIWINISEDNQITIIVAKAEMGQGISTALPMIVAEELEADWQKIKVELKGEMGEYSIGFMGVTGGSTSIATLFEPMREVGAAAKEMLITACANKWQVDQESLVAEKGYVKHPTSGQSISYGELAKEASELPVPENPTLKDPSEFTIIGQSLPRLDSPDHIEGKSVFGIDADVYGMLYAAVKQSPVFGGEVSNFTSLTIEGTGAEDIVEIPGGVAVIAKSYWEAEKVLQSLEIEFDNPEGMEELSSEDISEQLTQDLTKPGEQASLIGDPEAAMETASIKVDATYEVPFLAHGTMEPMTCTAKVTSESCEIWVPTQAAQMAQSAARTATGLDRSSIIVNTTCLGGGFGRKVGTDYVTQAAIAAQKVGKPVKVIWSREEDVRHDYYRPVFKAELKGGIDESNKIISWIGKSAGPPIMAWGSIDFMAIAGFSSIPYDTPNMSAYYVKSDIDIPIGWWRSVGSSQNGFFVESFVDELASAAGVDPLEFRKNHLKGRSRTVLEKAAEMANWGNASVPGAAQGVALGLHGGSITAQIAEVSVDSVGEVTVHKIYCAIDCGDVVNPDIVKAQMEGAVIFGLTAALYGEITIEKGRVQQSNFHDYPILTLKDAPPVETEIIISGSRRTGVGESGVPPIAPAVTNAIFAATEHRIRRLPVSRYDFF